MKIENAYKIINGELNPNDIKITNAELIQLTLNACLLDDDLSIICLQCGFPNENCICEKIDYQKNIAYNQLIKIIYENR